MLKLTALITLTLSFSTLAATQGTLFLRGVVPQLLSVEVTPESTAQNLDLSTSQINLKVAEVREKSNSATGYKVLISSMNGGKLLNGTDEFPYSIRYAGVSQVLTNSDYEIRNVSSRGVTDSDVEISYTGVAPELLTAGDYTDTITFTIQAN